MARLGQFLSLCQTDHEIQTPQLEAPIFYNFEIFRSLIYILFSNNFDASFVFNRDQWTSPLDDGLRILS